MTAEKNAKVFTAVTYTFVHVLAILGAAGIIPPIPTNFAIPEDLDQGKQWAMIVPITSVMIFCVLHIFDSRRKNESKERRIGGLATRVFEAKKAGAVAGDFASSAISRLSIHSALAIGVTLAILKFDKPSTLASLIEGILVVAVMLGMVSVLCYAHSARWSNQDSGNLEAGRKSSLRGELLKNAAQIDQWSWYALTVGLIWAIALKSPSFSIAISFAYGFLLWFFYYFRWDMKPTSAGTGSNISDLDDLRTSVEAWKSAQAAIVKPLESSVSKIEEILEKERELDRLIRLHKEIVTPSPNK